MFRPSNFFGGFFVKGYVEWKNKIELSEVVKMGNGNCPFCGRVLEFEITPYFEGAIRTYMCQHCNRHISVKQEGENLTLSPIWSLYSGQLKKVDYQFKVYEFGDDPLTVHLTDGVRRAYAMVCALDGSPVGYVVQKELGNFDMHVVVGAFKAIYPFASYDAALSDLVGYAFRTECLG